VRVRQRNPDAAKGSRTEIDVAFVCCDALKNQAAGQKWMFAFALVMLFRRKPQVDSQPRPYANCSLAVLRADALPLSPSPSLLGAHLSSRAWARTSLSLTLFTSQSWLPRAWTLMQVYDAAYALYISNPDCPRTIYEIPGIAHCLQEGIGDTNTLPAACVGVFEGMCLSG